MICSYRLIYTVLLFIAIITGAWSQAPVIDDSENFVLIDGQKADFNIPESRVTQLASRDNERPLAQDDTVSKTQNNPDFYNKMMGLQQEIQELRGQIEIQAHEIKKLKEQSTAYYRDLDERLRNSENKTGASTTPLQAQISTPQTQKQEQALPVDTNNDNPQKASSEAIAISANPADEQVSYMAAYELIKNRQFDDALKAMQSFISLYPHGGYAANAHYWLGELYLVKKEYAQAVIQFEIVNRQYPTSSKAAPSILKIGYALAATGKKHEAKQKLAEVIKSYPGTTSAQLAQEKLKTL